MRRCGPSLGPPDAARDARAAANGFGYLALSALMADRASADPTTRRGPHFRPRAKNVIFCFMDGGVSHVDSFDPKPKLDGARRQGRSPSRRTRPPTATGSGSRARGSSGSTASRGMPVSELFPHIASCADDLAVIRSMKADLPLHSTGVLFLHTGSNNAGRPSLGSWVNYGLGSENQNLPGFVVLSFGVVPCGGLENFSSGFLPGQPPGHALAGRRHADRQHRPRRQGPPASSGPSSTCSREQDEAFSAIARRRRRRRGGDQELRDGLPHAVARARRARPRPRDRGDAEALRHRFATSRRKRLYGIQCLRARRLVEAGVRFVEITCPPGASNGTWDQHGDLKKGHEKNALDTDQADRRPAQGPQGAAACSTRRWSSGPASSAARRTPPAATAATITPKASRVWLAGGGVKGGTIYGATDELGMHAVENVCTMHDLHATILHLLGLDHERLTYRFGGRDFRLTDVHGRVVKEVLA